MSVLKSPTLILPEETSLGTSALPTITWELIEQEILETLYQVLHYLHPVADTDTSIVNVLNLPPSKSKAHLDFFERTFPGTLATDKPAIWVEHTDKYQLVVDLSKPLNVGSLISFLNFVVNFHFTKQLSFVFKGNYDLNYYEINALERNTILGNFDQASKDDILQPIIFKYLKTILLEKGFIDIYKPRPNSISGMIDVRTFLNRYLYPNTPIKSYAILSNLFINPPSGSNSPRFIFERYIKFIVVPTDENQKIQIFYNAIYDYLQEFYVVHTDLINKYLGVLYYQIFNISKVELKFNTVLLGSGNGSGTLGFFDVLNLGVSFFQYKFHKSSNQKDFVVDKNIKVLQSPPKNKSVVVNLNVFGLDESPLSYGNYELGFAKIMIVANGHVCRIDFKKLIVGKAVVALPLVTDSLVSQLNSSHFRLPRINYLERITGTSIWNMYENIGDSIPIFIFDDKSFEFSYESDGVDISIYVFSERFEEFFLIASVVENILKKFNFELVNLFENDRFELTTTTRDFQFLNDVSTEDLIEVAKLFSLNTTTFDKICEVNVVGKFIGKKDTNSDVVSDKDYTIYRTTTSTHTATSKVEQFIPPASGSETDLYYTKLRYSKGSVEYSSNKLKIYIESFVSPLRSRLDKRILGPNLNSTGNPETDIFDYRSNLAGRKADVLDLYTLLGSGVSPDAYLLTNEDEPFDAVTNPKIASYNQLLSALRSLGVLEAFLDRILMCAEKEIDNNTSNAIDMNTTNISSNIDSILTRIKCATIRESEDPTSTIKTIDINTYRALKWYVSPEDKNRFAHSN